MGIAKYDKFERYLWNTFLLKFCEKKFDGIFDEKILTKIYFKAVLIEIPCFYSNRSLLVRLGLVFRVRVFIPFRVIPFRSKL